MKLVALAIAAILATNAFAQTTAEDNPHAPPVPDTAPTAVLLVVACAGLAAMRRRKR